MKAYRILEAAKNSATTKETKNRLEEITWAEDYAEPGYSLLRPEKKAGIYFANWNEADIYDPIRKERVKVSDSKILPRLAAALEKCGAEIEWSDEWSVCDDCGRALMTQPDSFFWTPSYKANYDKGSFLCKECADEDIEPDQSDSESTYGWTDEEP